jgi:ATP-dependent protease ClpP protease subunit
LTILYSTFIYEIKLIIGGTFVVNDTEFVIDLPEDLFDTKLPNSYSLKYYHDLNDRTIWINDEINSELTHELVHYIIRWNREDKNVPEIDRKPIKLLFDSPGGDLDA